MRTRIVRIYANHSTQRQWVPGNPPWEYSAHIPGNMALRLLADGSTRWDKLWCRSPEYEIREQLRPHFEGALVRCKMLGHRVHIDVEIPDLTIAHGGNPDP